MAGGPPKQTKNKKSKTTTTGKVDNLIFFLSTRWSFLHTLATVHIHSKLQSNLSIVPEYKLLMLCFFSFLFQYFFVRKYHSVLGSTFFQELWFLQTIIHLFSISLFLPEVWMNYILLVFFSDCSNSSKAEGSLFFRVSLYFFLTLYSE